MSRKPLMAGNWKMNLNHFEAMHLVQDLAFRLTDADHEAVEVVVLPPFTDLRSLQTLIDADHLAIGYGAQDVSTHDHGAYTGEISGSMLAKLGCEVAVAAHGGEAISYLERHPVDLVLMDCNMPVMDGYEATRRIRQSGRWPSLPVIALTANALPDERERCQAAGMNDYLAKPFRREDLASLLDSWLPLKSAS